MVSVRLDDELTNIRRIMTIMAAMTPTARRRVLSYVSDRVEMMTPFPALEKPFEATRQEPDLLGEEAA
jgi:hypothetical protein